jgi:hypothetical protein
LGIGGCAEMNPTNRRASRVLIGSSNNTRLMPDATLLFS